MSLMGFVDTLIGSESIMDDNKPLVSILVSLYNVERFLLKKRLRDLREQSYENVEIILVDDGATDNTPFIADELAREDCRIKVIHKENGGLGSARNAGLDSARGDYLYFCDVDDDLHLNTIERCVELMKLHEVDMLIFGFNVIYDSGELPPDTVLFEDRQFQNNDELKANAVSMVLDIPPLGNGFVWNKFYRRDFLEKQHFRFGNYKIQQDEVFNMQLYPYINRLYLSSDVLYDYYVYESGNNRSRYIPDRLELYFSIFKTLEEIGRKWGVRDTRFMQFIDQKLYNSINGVFWEYDFSQECHFSYSQRKKRFKDFFSDSEVKQFLARKHRYNNFVGIKSRFYYLTYRCRSYELLMIFKYLFKIGDKYHLF